MSVIIKRSEGVVGVNECSYGCCTPVYGKNVKKIRRTAKRAENQKVRKDIEREVRDSN